MEETGYLHNYTPDEYQIVEEVRRYMESELDTPDEMRTTWYLLRFCRARKFKLEKVIEMMRNFIQWKTERGIMKSGDIDMQQFKSIKEYSAFGYYHTDKEGRPVYIEKVNELKPKEMFAKFSDPQLFAFYIQSYDRLLHIIYPTCSQIAGRRIEKNVTIMDLKKVSLMSLFFGKVKKFVKIASKIAQDYYPEMLGKLYIVNSGWMFRGIWGMVKGWIDKKTQKKITIISGSGKKELLKQIDADKLPIFLGGECEDDIRDDPGPWKQEILMSYDKRTVHISNQNIIRDYYLTKQEQEQFDERQNAIQQDPNQIAQPQEKPEVTENMTQL